jgi:hypothetical protein
MRRFAKSVNPMSFPEAEGTLEIAISGSMEPVEGNCCGNSEKTKAIPKVIP